MGSICYHDVANEEMCPPFVGCGQHRKFDPRSGDYPDPCDGLVPSGRVLEIKASNRLVALV